MIYRVNLVLVRTKHPHDLVHPFIAQPHPHDAHPDVAAVRDDVFERQVSPGMGVVFQNLTRAAENEINRYLLGHESIFYEAV